jgi:hypothetical protein
VDAVRGRGFVAVVNNVSFLMAPWADLLYSCDSAWWNHYAEELVGFKGERVSIDPKAHGRHGVRTLRKEDGDGLGRRAIRTGCNSGYQLINLAYLRGAKTIVLLGYDMQFSEGDTGRHHFHADHPKPLGNFARGMPKLCASKFPALAKDLSEDGVRVVNCTRQTALSCFERAPLSEVLAQLDPALPVNHPPRAGLMPPT